MEKTFEELIEEKQYDVDNFNVAVSCDDVLQLMQQVREETIAEVLKLCDDNFFSKEPKGKLMENIENIQTDRIKLTEKK